MFDFSHCAGRKQLQISYLASKIALIKLVSACKNMFSKPYAYAYAYVQFLTLCNRKTAANNEIKLQNSCNLVGQSLAKRTGQKCARMGCFG